MSFTTGLGSINRIDANRVVVVSGDLAEGYNGNAVLGEVQRRLADFELDPGYSMSFTGESEDQAESMAFLSEAFGIALLLVLIVLISQFNSITNPFIIMTSIALSLIGVLWGLMLTRTPFGIIMTLPGFTSA